MEHTGGLIRNNIVMNCADVGLYLNRAKDTLVLNNLFYRTMGIDVRFEQSTAEIKNNIVDGKIKSRDGGTFSSSHNLVFRGLTNIFGPQPQDCFADPARTDFRLKDGRDILDKGLPHGDIAHLDICGQSWGKKPNIGPFAYSNLPLCTLLDFSGAEQTAGKP